MKKFGLLFLLAVSPLTAFSTNSQNVVKFHIDFDSKDFYLGEINGKNYISSDRYHLEFTSDKQSPALPYISISIPIKESQKYIGHTVTKREKLYMDNISIIPNTIFLKADSKKKVTKVEPVDYQGKIYPSSSIIYAGFYNCRGNCKLSFLLCPFRYDDSTKELFLTKTIDLSITMSDNAIATNRPNSKQTNRLLSDTVYHCIILTSRNLAPQYQKLANWKSRKGVRTKLLTVEDIYDEDLSNESNALKIKRVLNDYYELDSLNGLKYLLLGGDASIIPVQKGFVSFENGSSTENKLIPTDLYYACFDSMDWDTNGNGLPGEIADSIDITPDVGI